MGDEFITNFHSLAGVTVGDRRKSLYLLLNKTAQPIDFSSLHPRTPLEENFKVDALIHFRKVPELLEVLQNENPIHIQKVLKESSWFIREAFGSMTGEELAGKIFPRLSYNGKLKLLNQLMMHLNDTQKAEEFFESIKEKYGLYLATHLLAACSDDVFMKCLKSNKIEITSKQLLIFIQKYPALTEDVLNELERYGKTCFTTKYAKIFYYLFKNDFELFLKLSEKYEFKIRLGARATTSFITKEKGKILGDSKTFFKILDKEQIGRRLKDDFKDFYIKVFPESLGSLATELYCYFDDMLKHMKSNSEKLELFADTFKTVHGTEVWDHSEFISSKLIGMMHNEEREKWLSSHEKPEEISEREWMSFMGIQKSIPWIKEQISKSSKIKERVKLVNSLVYTCKINNDKAALLEACKYIIEKHRNDHATVRQEFLKTIAHLYDLKKLDGKFWEYINELTTLSKIKHEEFSESRQILECYIYYCLENQLPIKDLLVEWVKFNYNYNICQRKPEYEKRCLLMFNETFPGAYKKDKLEDQYISYLKCLTEWNDRNPKNKISLFLNDEAIRQVKLRLNKGERYSYYEELMALKCIKSNENTKPDMELIRLALQKQTHYFYGEKIVWWLLKNHPLLLLDSVDAIINDIITARHYRYFKAYLFGYYHHLGIPQRIVQICREAVEKFDKGERKTAIVGLSFAMPPEDFLQFISPFYPINPKVDLKTDQEQNTYQIQQAVAHCLKNIVPSSLTLEAILKFCQGDYLNLVQESLHTITNNVQENKLDRLFDTLQERPVSVKKHAIILGFKTLNKSKTYEMLRKLMEKENNSSIRKSIFKGTLNFFMRNPDDCGWDLVKKTMKTVDDTDVDALTFLAKFKNIPPNYCERYIVFAWEILEGFDKPNETVDAAKCSLLDSIIRHNVDVLPEEFSLKIIEKYLFNKKININSFVCKFLIHRDDYEKNIKTVLRMVKKHMDSSLYDVKTMKDTQQNVFDFVKKFCTDFLDDKLLPKEIHETFLHVWNDLIKPNYAFDEYLYIQLTQLYLICVHEKLSITQIGESLAKLCDSLYDQQTLVLSIFLHSFNLFKGKLFSSDLGGVTKENDLILVDGILKTSCSSACLTFIVHLLPNDDMLSKGMIIKLNEIIKTISAKGNHLVLTHLHHYFVIGLDKMDNW